MPILIYCKIRYNVISMILSKESGEKLSLFDNERVMYIPLSIDEVETKKISYFFSSAKIVEMVIALIPYFFLLFPLMQGGQIIPMIIITVVYAFLFLIFFRFRIMEEGRLRRMLRELDANKLSGLNYFWGINKIGSKGIDDGVIHYERSGIATERGLVVTYNRGSLVAVPEGSYTDYREAKIRFIQELANHNFDFTWYEIPVKEDDIPPSLVHIFNRMTMMSNPVYKQLLKLQLDINVAYTIGEGIGYRDFILIRNKNFKTLRRFREIMENIVANTLAHDKYIIEPRVLNKNEVERFFGQVLMINPIDSNSIKRNVDYRPITDFAEVVRIIGQDGADVPLEFIDLTDFIEPKKKDSLEDRLEKDLRKYEENLKTIEKLEQGEILRTKTMRNNDNITDKEYNAKLAEIKSKFDSYRELVEENKYDDFNITTHLRELSRLEREKATKARLSKEKSRGKGSSRNKDMEEVELDYSIEELNINTTEDKKELVDTLRQEQELSYIELDEDLSLEEMLAQERKLEEVRKRGEKLYVREREERETPRRRKDDYDDFNEEEIFGQVDDSDEELSLEEMLRKEQKKKKRRR